MICLRVVYCSSKVLRSFSDKPCVKLLLIFLLIFSVNSLVWAETQTLGTAQGRILIPTLKNWELGKNLFGMPFLYFSPQANGQRSNISFTDTGVNLEIDLSRLRQNSESYQKIKKDWAKSVGGKISSYHPFKIWKNDQGHAVHEIGVEFIHENNSYLEKSFYVDCRGKLIFAKSLRLKVNQEHQKDFDFLMNKLDCGG